MGLTLLTERYAPQIAGVLCCWDRILLFGTLPKICYAEGMTSYLYERKIRIFDYAKFAEHEVSKSSYEDTRRGMSRGSNHSTQEATQDTGREQEAQVGRRKTSAITRSTGLRRRERRFESCRGHHL